VGSFARTHHQRGELGEFFWRLRTHSAQLRECAAQCVDVMTQQRVTQRLTRSLEWIGGIAMASDRLEQQRDRRYQQQRSKNSPRFGLREFAYWDAPLFRLRRRERPASAIAPGTSCARAPGSGTL